MNEFVFLLLDSINWIALMQHAMAIATDYSYIIGGCLDRIIGFK